MEGDYVISLIARSAVYGLSCPSKDWTFYKHECFNDKVLIWFSSLSNDKSSCMSSSSALSLAGVESNLVMTRQILVANEPPFVWLEPTHEVFASYLSKVKALIDMALVDWTCINLNYFVWGVMEPLAEACAVGVAQPIGTG